jgi:predicted RNase H-like nuclease
MFLIVIVTGIDGCKSGWIAVSLLPVGADLPFPVRVRTGRTLDELDIQGVTGIDMPLGLVADGWRTVDGLARRALGGRGASVFAIPPRPVWAAPDYASANRRCRELTGRGMSAQAWGLRAKLLEADAFRRGCAQPLHEVHPELSFAALSGGPLADSKHVPAGVAVRRALLEGAGIALPERVAGAAAHDVLDAAAVAWSAGRIAAGTARVLSGTLTQRSDDGFDITISY